MPYRQYFPENGYLPWILSSTRVRRRLQCSIKDRKERQSTCKKKKIKKKIHYYHDYSLMCCINMTHKERSLSPPPQKILFWLLFESQTLFAAPEKLCTAVWTMSAIRLTNTITSSCKHSVVSVNCLISQKPKIACTLFPGIMGFNFPWPLCILCAMISAPASPKPLKKKKKKKVYKIIIKWKWKGERKESKSYFLFYTNLK